MNPPLVLLIRKALICFEFIPDHDTMKPTLLTSFLLMASSVFSQTTIYPYIVEPKKYPDYYRRCFTAPTPKETFIDTVRFVSGRYVEPTRANLFYGDYYRPNQGWILNQSYFDFLSDILTMNKEKIGAFDIAGYGPGSPYSGSFGQKAIPSNRLELLNKLGVLYVGNSLGEQDGRFWADQRQLMEPYSRDPKIQHTIYLDYMRQNAKDYGYKLTQLSTYWGFHYMPKDGYVSLAGSECQNKDRVAQMQVQYAFNRGIARQYGLLSFGDISVFNTWGWKGNTSDPYGGTSYALMRRMMALQFQYNAWILGIESGWGTMADPQPIGKIQLGMYNLVNTQLPNPGSMHVPVAFLTDFFSGWMPPYHDTYLKWGFLPYEKGQYLTHYLFDMVYPNYQNNGQSKDETPALVPNPYGDVDALLSDVQKELLLQYPVIVIADELVTDTGEMKDNLDYYVQQGGHLVLTAVNAQKIFPAGSFSSYVPVAGGASVNYKDTVLTETSSFLLCSPLFADYHIIATTNGKPVAIEYTKGKGKYTILLTDYGMSNSTGKPSLLKQTRLIVSDILSGKQLFTAGKNLTCTTDILNDSTFIVGIYNNSLSQQPMTVQSKIGPVSSIAEYSLGEDLTDEAGYTPTGSTVVYGSNSATAIRALDVRLFKITVHQPSVKALSEISYPTLPQHKYLAVDNFFQLKNTISGFPHFFHHFSGVKVDWDAIGKAENKAFKDNVVWMNHQKLELVVDFCNTFPVADFRPENVIEYYSLNTKLANLKTNLQLFSGKKTIVLPEPTNQLEDTGLEELKRLCLKMGADVLMKSCKPVQGKACSYDGTKNAADSASLVYLEPADSAIDMTALNKVYQATPVVFNYHLTSWDSIYHCLDAVINSKKLAVSQQNQVQDKERTTASENAWKLVSFHNIQCLKSEILNHQDDFFSYFGGVKIDGSYLWNLSEEACREEGRWLKTHQVKVIVDLVREINHYPGLTWTKELDSYGKGKTMMDNILLKMKLIGSKDIIIGSHMRCELWSETSYTNQTSIKNGMKTFIDSAVSKGITVHIQHREYQNYPQRLLASPTETMSLINSFSGTRFAANLGVYSDPVYLTGLAKSKLGLVILAYKGDSGLDCRNPLYKGMYNKSKPDLSTVSNLSVPMILDAEYQSWDEVLLDCSALGWSKVVK
ncbi:MAG: hypothetical protein Q8914_08510 [Bacteroidota bacterium]|nr:hypothetical protein [Bacteroidota bacterium]